MTENAPELIPGEWASGMIRLLERFETPAAVDIWRPIAEDRPYMFGVFVKRAPDDAQDPNRETVRADVIEIFDQFPAALWAMTGVDSMLEHCASAIGKQRGGGDERMTPTRNDPDERLAAIGMIALEGLEDTPEDEYWPSLYVTDIEENFYLRERMGQCTTITQWGEIDDFVEEDRNDPETFWRRQLETRPGLSVVHIRLGHILAACTLPREDCAEFFGDALMTDENADEIMTRLMPFLTFIGAVSPYDPRNPMRSN